MSDNQKTPTTTTTTTPPPPHDLLSPSIRSLDFAQDRAARPLRVCCYGSSSSQTPTAYLRPAAEVGYLLAKRGHTCVNGAGSCGCMAAMNEGAAAGNGHIVGVIHEMWLVDGPANDDSKTRDWKLVGGDPRDGGAHAVFAQAGKRQQQQQQQEPREGPIREMIVAGGKDLQERKRLLVEGADALLVLPGGPGTWDELWEMACARNLGLSTLPICCVNVDGYYEPFRAMLDRAWKDKLTKVEPSETIFFANTAEEAVRWVEDVQSKAPPNVNLQARKPNNDSLLHTRNVGGSLAAGLATIVPPPGEILKGSLLVTLGVILGMWIARKQGR